MGLRNLVDDWGMVLAALYLPGAPHGLHLERRRWPLVLRALRSGGMTAETAAGEGLQMAGHVGEASALRSANSLEWAWVQAGEGRVATCLDADYPARWLSILGDQAPPALWRMGASSGLPCLGVVGSRDVDPEVHRFCSAVGREAVRIGFRVVSGGASGCDSAALRGASEVGGETLVLAPFGIELAEEDLPPGRTVLSACEPAEGFSRGRAMARNALIYASGRVCVVGQVRFRQGGTWHGAVDALRRRSCAVLVRKPGKYDPEEASRGAQALVALGARYLASPLGLEAAVASLPLEEDLFGFSGVAGVA